MLAEALPCVTANLSYKKFSLLVKLLDDFSILCIAARDYINCDFGRNESHVCRDIWHAGMQLTGKCIQK